MGRLPRAWGTVKPGPVQGPAVAAIAPQIAPHTPWQMSHRSRLDLAQLDPNLRGMFKGLILLLSLLPGWLCAAQLERLNHVLAVVGQTPITLGDIEAQTAPLEQALVQQFRSNPTALRQQVLQLKQEALETLVERQLILMEFDELGYQLPEKIIDERVQDRIRERFGDRLTLTQTLQAQGVTFEAFRQDIKTTVIVDYLTSKQVESATLVSPNDIRQYYQEHLEDFQQEPQIRLRMIFLKADQNTQVSAQAMLGEIRKKVAEGGDFGSLARVYHQGSQRAQGGDWGWVDQSVLRADLSAAAFKIPEGETSEVICADEGCYLLYVQEIRPPEPKSLASVQQEIESILLTQEKGRLKDEWIKRLKAKNYVRYF
jgi:peptidyl-prolyl cis-trans isomerase SurA